MPFLLDASPDKTALRTLARQRRRALAVTQRIQAQAEVASILQQRIARHGWRRIAGYAAVASELDLSPLYAQLDVELALPAIDDAGLMQFRRWQPGEPLVPGPFAIAQPDRLAVVIEPHAFDAVLLPLLGFDGRGVRLGSGAGYYDRCFAFRCRQAGPVLIGVAFAVQQFDALPVDPWDVRLDAVVSERGWQDISG